MRQVTFSSQSLDAISGLPQVGQLSLIEKLSSLSSEILAKNQSGVGKFVHKGKTFYRIRIDDMRIYLEQDGDALHCQFILEKNSFQDFLVRCNMPASEESVVENHQGFWDYLDSLRKK